MTDADLLSARETCQILGISQATLYAYVSRGLLESRPGPDHRSRLYPRHDVERLAQRKQAGRGAARGAAQSLDRGLPVLETQISLIRPDGPYYRGRSAIAAVHDGATLEDIARLLWDCGEHDPFAIAVDSTMAGERGGSRQRRAPAATGTRDVGDSVAGVGSTPFLQFRAARASRDRGHAVAS